VSAPAPQALSPSRTTSKESLTGPGSPGHGGAGHKTPTSSLAVVDKDAQGVQSASGEASALRAQIARMEIDYKDKISKMQQEVR
jgi:hypothetical protein